MRIPVILGTVISTIAPGVLLAAPSSAADFGALKNCGEGRTALASKGAKAAAASGINCHWLAGDAKRVICTWEKKKMRGGGSGGSLYAEVITAATSTSSKG